MTALLSTPRIAAANVKSAYRGDRVVRAFSSEAVTIDTLLRFHPERFWMLDRFGAEVLRVDRSVTAFALLLPNASDAQKSYAVPVAIEGVSLVGRYATVAYRVNLFGTERVELAPMHAFLTDPQDGTRVWLADKQSMVDLAVDMNSGHFLD